MTILRVQVMQISSMKAIGLMVDFKQIVQHLSMEFYGEWQLLATHHRTQYLTVKLTVSTDIYHGTNALC